MHSITLTKPERSAIDWVGHRYRHGDDLRDVLEQAEVTNNVVGLDFNESWPGECDLTFNLTEAQAWEVQTIINEDPRLACFADGLAGKLHEFCSKIA
jgi:hypothetical protein